MLKSVLHSITTAKDVKGCCGILNNGYRYPREDTYIKYVETDSGTYQIDLEDYDSNMNKVRWNIQRFMEIIAIQFICGTACEKLEKLRK